MFPRLKLLSALPTLVLCLAALGCAGQPSGETPDAGAPDADADTGNRVKVPASFDVEAHRGGRSLRPDNTLPAFETAIDLGVDTLEMDLHFTSDSVLVVWHDPHVSAASCALDPAAEAPLPPDPEALPAEDPALLIRSLDLASLQKYRCDKNSAPVSFPSQQNGPTALAGDDYRIATLGQVLDFVDGYSKSTEKTAEQRAWAAKVRFNIESKRDPSNPETIGDGFDGMTPGPFEQAIVAEIVAKGVAGRTIVQSFDHRSLWAVRNLNTDVGLSALTKIETIDFADYASQGATHWSPLAAAALPESIEAAHAAGLLVLPWTVNKENDMRDLIEAGADGLITDVPDVLLGIIEREP